MSMPSNTKHPSPSGGLAGVVVGETAICNISKQTGLSYRGYAIEDLCNICCFEEILFLLLRKYLPTSSELQQQNNIIKKYANIHPKILNALELIPKTAHPMDVLRVGCCMLGILYPETNSEESQADAALRLTSSYPSILFYWHYYSRFNKRININNFINKINNNNSIISMLFLKLMHGNPDFQPDPLVLRTVDVSLILYAEHDFNASTFASRITAGTRSDIYSCINTGINTLKGNLHGGANEAALNMLKDLGNQTTADIILNDMLKNKKLVMGFGHRVYKSGDPRAKILKTFAESLALKKNKNYELYILSDFVENKMKKKQLFPNVDFPAAVAYTQCGISAEYFTPLFVIARTSGWYAHILEQREKKKIIRPSSVYVGPGIRECIPIYKRNINDKDRYQYKYMSKL